MTRLETAAWRAAWITPRTSMGLASETTLTLAVDTVKGVQARLSNLGYDPGPIDGIVGPRTRAAVRRFQQEHDLKVDGIAGPNTQAKLDEIYG